MRVHHLNCGTLRPLATPGGLVCHVLVVETDDGLVLVDSGFGLADAANPGRRFGMARPWVRPAFDPDEAAVRQLARLGFAAHDVRHVVLTHFDADHTGGLADFRRRRSTSPPRRRRRRCTPRPWSRGSATRQASETTGRRS